MKPKIAFAGLGLAVAFLLYASVLLDIPRLVQPALLQVQQQQARLDRLETELDGQRAQRNLSMPTPAPLQRYDYASEIRRENEELSRQRDASRWQRQLDDIKQRVADPMRLP